MLKKLNGNITKLLLYIKNNLVSCVFKFSILSTMLILVYLVWMLSKTDTVSSSESRGVYPIENSQKLMLTIPTEIPSDTSSDLDNIYSTTEYLETTSIIDNSISKNDDMYIGTHPLIPIQEPITTPMPLIGEIELEKQLIPEETIVTTSEPESTTEEKIVLTTPTEETITENMDDTNFVQETTSTDAIVSISNPTIPDIDNSLNALPIKRSLSIDAQQTLKTTSIETTTQSQMEISTTPTISFEPTDKKEIPTTNLPTLTSSQDVEHLQNSTSAPVLSITPQNSKDNLFMDNWAYYTSTENEDRFKDDSSSQLNFMEEPTKSLFRNEDSELTSIESPILKNNSNDSSLLDLQVKNDIENSSHLRYSDTEESPPIFSPQNLLNLFSTDHQPSASNLKTTWWPKSKSSSMSDLAESAAKSQQKRANRISPNDESQEMSGNERRFSQRFDTLLNRRLKNSVTILEKLFGNYFLQ